MKRPFRRSLICALVCCAVVVIAMAVGAALPGQALAGQWITGDHHSHSYLSDGERPLAEVIDRGLGTWNLGWMATADHGGVSKKDAWGTWLPAPIWVWQSLKDYSYPIYVEKRAQYPGKVLVQGFEWGIPGAEEAKVGIAADGPYALSDFEYMFEKKDLDTSREGLSAITGDPLLKLNVTPEDGVAAVAWLQRYYAGRSYAICSHPSRALGWTVDDIRDVNNAAPDVAFGFAGIPGSQKDPEGRCSYDNFFYVDPSLPPEDRVVDWETTAKARTYGGADYMVARLGGLWDSLLGEGRRFWVFSDSDFHEPVEEFWPGEYSKDHTWVDSATATGVTAGLRSGNSFSVMGQLIDGLDYKAATKTASAAMGGTLSVKSGTSVTITVKFHSPVVNNGGYVPTVNHVDLISGDVTGRIAPASPEYETRDYNSTTAVAKRFNATNWKLSKGWYTMSFAVKATKDQYFRLRGTNLGLNILNQTDANGNPLMDDLMGVNDEAKAWADLWFYANPIFIDVQ